MMKKTDDQPGLLQSWGGVSLFARILIDAQFKLDDGTIATCRVLTVDKIKEAVARFVGKHSLSAGVKSPLIHYLTKVEMYAEKFPVEIEADITDICARYTSGWF